MEELGNVNYQVVISETILKKICKYRFDLIDKKIDAGKHLKATISGLELSDVSICKFIQLLLWTKKPRIFAEIEVRCNGSDWNNVEFAILGGINIVMRVCAYDNGVWNENQILKYRNPLDVELLFSPGIMLNTSASGVHNPDYSEVVENKKINQEKYNALVEQRLLPLLAHANHKAENGKKAFIVLPGIGCGNFAGSFSGQMQRKLDAALQAMIGKYKFSNIKGIQLGLYANSFEVKPKIINDIIYEVRGNGLPQLSDTKMYDKMFKDCRLYKVVAWDHVSWPGNDFFFCNTRNTDDGVSAAATNSMEILTGLKGSYRNGLYIPPHKYKDWENVVKSEGIKLIADKNNIKVVTQDGKYHAYESSDIQLIINSYMSN